MKATRSLFTRSVLPWTLLPSCQGGWIVQKSKKNLSSFLKSSPSADPHEDSISQCNLLSNLFELNYDYFLLRHGQSKANVAGLIASNPTVACTEYGLSPKGMEQALSAGHDVCKYYRRGRPRRATTAEGNQEASSFGPYKGVVLLASDLLRARQTAECVRDVIQQAKDIALYQENVILEKRLRERWFGNWDLQSDSNYQIVWEDDAQSSAHEKNGVESVNSVMARATSCIVDWDKRILQPQVNFEGADTTTGDRGCYMVVLVAHGDVLQILQTAFERKDGRQHRSLPHLETAQLRPVKLA